MISLYPGAWITLANGWTVGPIYKRISIGPFGKESTRYGVKQLTHGDWSEHGEAYIPEFNVTSVKDTP